ncbi:hypothetical protein [Vibrio parahaemolyticus]|uniref:SF0329 family protein n=1 Tax=Vibrio parahaemolyticus TaxID=670 RepID=UPI002362D4F0|nr:hypothetical protein [Vibrio parahaemolyticus]
MSKRWSKLQKELYAIRANDLNMQIHCSIYRMKSQRGQTDIPRYWISVDNEIVWDYPRHFLNEDNPSRANPKWFPHVTDIPNISALIREYIDTPKEEILSKQFSNDHWGLTNILKATDRRIGQRRLNDLSLMVGSETVDRIIRLRINTHNKTLKTD